MLREFFLLMRRKVATKLARRSTVINDIPQSFAILSRREFAITETELKLMAPAAIMGLSSRPKKGVSHKLLVGASASVVPAVVIHQRVSQHSIKPRHHAFLVLDLLALL